jgi:hypothetical protein
VHVYLPASYDGVKQFPVWVHLHGELGVELRLLLVLDTHPYIGIVVHIVCSRSSELGNRLVLLLVLQPEKAKQS